MENVNSISEWTFMNNNRTLILNKDGEVFEFLLSKNDKSHEAEYKISKITDNVKQKQSFIANVNRDFIDITRLTEETQEAIRSLSTAGVLEGKSKSEFLPDKTIIRAEAAAALLRIAGKEYNAEASFVDVNTEKWYYSIAGASYKYGIVNGFGDNSFRGEEDISGLQFLALAARVLRNESFSKITEATLKLPDSIPSWAAEDVSLAINEGLVTAEEAAELIGSENISRSKAAVLLYRLYGKI